MKPVIKMAEDKLGDLNSELLTRELDKAREYTEHEKANLYRSGRDDEKLEIARKLLLNKVDVNIIIASTGLTREKIERVQETL